MFNRLMKTSLSPNTKVAIRKMPAGHEYKVGDVIVFYMDGMEIIHRIVAIKVEDGEIRYYTQGQNPMKNFFRDKGYRTEKDIVGKADFSACILMLSRPDSLPCSNRSDQ